MVCFQTKTPNLGKFLRALNWKMIYFVAVFYKLWTFGKFCVDLVHFSGFRITSKKNLATLAKSLIELAFSLNAGT
jgi:hypothetical protein